MTGLLRLIGRSGRNGLALAANHQLITVQFGDHLDGRLQERQVPSVGVEQGLQDRRWRGDPGLPRRGQEQGLFHGAPPDQGVNDDPLAAYARLAPHLHGAGRLDQRAFVEALQHAGLMEAVETDVENEGRQRVELVLGERRKHRLVDGVSHGDQVVEQQGLGIVGRNLRALTCGQGVAMADRPAPVGQLGGGLAIALEPLDQLDRGSGHTVARLHAL